MYESIVDDGLGEGECFRRTVLELVILHLTLMHWVISYTTFYCKTSVQIFVMPPLPTTFDDATNASIASIQRRQNDLREFQLPRLRGCSESLTVQQQYAAELREDLETITRLVEVSSCKTLFLFVRYGCQ